MFSECAPKEEAKNMKVKDGSKDDGLFSAQGGDNVSKSTESNKVRRGWEASNATGAYDIAVVRTHTL